MDIKNGITHSHDVRVNKEYADWIVDIKKRYRNAQIKAAIRVNSDQLYFNWCLGRDLVLLRAEERWGKGVVEQVALDLQAEFPASKGFSTTNLFYMKKWFLFYVTYGRFEKVQQAAGELPDAPVPQPRQGAKSGERKLNQAGSRLQRQKLKQVDSEIQFPPFFGLIPWMHHVLIITKCKSIEEALFYIKKTIADNLSRSALENCIRADLYHTARAKEIAAHLPTAEELQTQISIAEKEYKRG